MGQPKWAQMEKLGQGYMVTHGITWVHFFGTKTLPHEQPLDGIEDQFGFQCKAYGPDLWPNLMI